MHRSPRVCRAEGMLQQEPGGAALKARLAQVAPGHVVSKTHVWPTRLQSSELSADRMAPPCPVGTWPHECIAPQNKPASLQGWAREPRPRPHLSQHKAQVIGWVATSSRRPSTRLASAGR